MGCSTVSTAHRETAHQDSRRLSPISTPRTLTFPDAGDDGTMARAHWCHSGAGTGPVNAVNRPIANFGRVKTSFYRVNKYSSLAARGNARLDGVEAIFMPTCYRRRGSASGTACFHQVQVCKVHGKTTMDERRNRKTNNIHSHMLYDLDLG